MCFAWTVAFCWMLRLRREGARGTCRPMMLWFLPQEASPVEYFLHFPECSKSNKTLSYFLSDINWNLSCNHGRLLFYWLLSACRPLWKCERQGEGVCPQAHRRQPFTMLGRTWRKLNRRGWMRTDGLGELVESACSEKPPRCTSLPSLTCPSCSNTHNGVLVTWNTINKLAPN